MKISQALFLVFLAFFTAHSAVIWLTNPAPAEKNNTGNSPTIPINSLIFVPTTNLESVFSIGPGFKLPYLQTLANYYYYPRATYYIRNSPTYWVAKKPTVPQSPKNETQNKNHENATIKVEKSDKNSSSQKETQKQGDQKLLDLGKNISTDNNNQIAKSNNTDGALKTEKNAVETAGKNNAEKNLKNQSGQVETVRVEKKVENASEIILVVSPVVSDQKVSHEEPTQKPIEQKSVDIQNEQKNKQNLKPEKSAAPETTQKVSHDQNDKKPESTDTSGSSKDNKPAEATASQNKPETAEPPKPDTPSQPQTPEKTSQHTAEPPATPTPQHTAQPPKEQPKKQSQGSP